MQEDFDFDSWADIAVIKYARNFLPRRERQLAIGSQEKLGQPDTRSDSPCAVQRSSSAAADIAQARQRESWRSIDRQVDVHDHEPTQSPSQGEKRCISEQTIGHQETSREHLHRQRLPPDGVTKEGTVSRQEPDWYQKVSPATGRAKDISTVTDTRLASLRGMIRKQVDATKKNFSGQTNVSFEDMADTLHEAMLYDVTAKQLRTHRLLHNEDGLPHLFDPEYSAGISYPVYIRADGSELYNKWCRRDFEPNLLRGIVQGKGKNEKLGRDKTTADHIDPGFVGRQYGTKHGSEGLVNGQWWPTQLCTLRDGAHNDTQGGISGRTNDGAWSVIVAGNKQYPDKDFGEELHYCGTDSQNGATTDNTRRLIENHEKKLPVRVIRSHNAKNKDFAPKAGFRYDGLYDVISYEQLDSTLRRYRFKLQRQAEQDSIRAKGVEARPTKQEMTEYKKLKEAKALVV